MVLLVGLRISVVQAVFAILLGGVVVCVQWITGRMCACVVSVCVCVFHESLGVVPSITACMDM